MTLTPHPEPSPLTLTLTLTPTPTLTTVQELVAAPTIFGEDGVLVGSKAVKLFAFDPQTGQPLYWQDSASDDCDKEDACNTQEPPRAGGGAEEDGSGPGGTEERGQLLLSRSDYKVRVLERYSGQQRWNVSLAQYSLTMEPPRHAPPPRRAPPLQLRLQLQEDQSLCASASARGECVWSRPFASAPVLAYHVDRVTGALQQLDFQPMRAAPLPEPQRAGGGTERDGGDGAREPLAVMELVPTQSQEEAADLIEHAMEGSMALTTPRQQFVAQPLLPLLPLLAPLLPGKLQAPLRRHHAQALLGRPLLVSGEREPPLPSGFGPLLPPGGLAPWRQPQRHTGLHMGLRVPPPGAPLAPFGEAPLSEATVRQLLQAVELRAAAEARQKPFLWTAGILLPLLLLYSWWKRKPHRARTPG